MEQSKPGTIGILTNSRTLCAALDKYRLPRAIVRIEKRSFVAWNRAFLSLTGFSDDRLWSVNAEDIVTLGNPVFEAPGLVACVVRTADARRSLTGHASIGDDGSVYIMLDPEDAFEQGRIIGRQEEYANVKEIFREAVSPVLSIALPALAEVERELKATHSPQADKIAKATRLIDNVMEKIVRSLNLEEERRGDGSEL
jgi:hypothetical protein